MVTARGTEHYCCNPDFPSLDQSSTVDAISHGGTVEGFTEVAVKGSEVMVEGDSCLATDTPSCPQLQLF